ncbi:MAG: hypothetical protein ACTH2Q_10455 [Propionibacteriaceae bacterium]
MAKIVSIPKPDIALPTSRPTVPVERFRERLTAAEEALSTHGLDFFVVYGDRERAGDLQYLSGIDPRFEEGILVMSRDGARYILLGNENIGRAAGSELGLVGQLFQELSPQGQLRDQPVQLIDLLRKCGVSSGAKVGVVGGKSFSSGFVVDPDRSFGVPAYVVDTLRELVGAEGITNAQQLFVHPEHGLRSINTAHEIAEAEYASAIGSASVHTATLGIHVGARADEVATLLGHGGLQLSVHPMVNFGERTRYGLVSPTDQRAVLGEAFQIAHGLRGALNCRSGMIAAGPDDLDGRADYFEALTLNYFDTQVAWYETLRVGATGGEVFAAADSARDGGLFTFSLNPGHTLGYEEWLESPFAPDHPAVLRSGLLVQCDIIPDYEGTAVGANIEDGVALADGALRDKLAETHPETYERIQARRTYVSEVIGVTLDESVLPLSNTPLWHAPYILDPSRALTT